MLLLKQMKPGIIHSWGKDRYFADQIRNKYLFHSFYPFSNLFLIWYQGSNAGNQFIQNQMLINLKLILGQKGPNPQIIKNHLVPRSVTPAGKASLKLPPVAMEKILSRQQLPRPVSSITSSGSSVLQSAPRQLSRPAATPNKSYEAGINESLSLGNNWPDRLPTQRTGLEAYQAALMNRRPGKYFPFPADASSRRYHAAQTSSSLLKNFFPGIAAAHEMKPGSESAHRAAINRISPVHVAIPLKMDRLLNIPDRSQSYNLYWSKAKSEPFRNLNLRPGKSAARYQNGPQLDRFSGNKYQPAAGKFAARYAATLLSNAHVPGWYQYTQSQLRKINFPHPEAYRRLLRKSYSNWTYRFPTQRTESETYKSALMNRHPGMVFLFPADLSSPRQYTVRTTGNSPLKSSFPGTAAAHEMKPGSQSAHRAAINRISPVHAAIPLKMDRLLNIPDSSQSYNLYWSKAKSEPFRNLNLQPGKSAAHYQNGPQLDRFSGNKYQPAAGKFAARYATTLPANASEPGGYHSPYPGAYHRLFRQSQPAIQVSIFTGGKQPAPRTILDKISPSNSNYAILPFYSTRQVPENILQPPVASPVSGRQNSMQSAKWRVRFASGSNAVSILKLIGAPAPAGYKLSLGKPFSAAPEKRIRQSSLPKVSPGKALPASPISLDKTGNFSIGWPLSAWPGAMTNRAYKRTSIYASPAAYKTRPAWAVKRPRNIFLHRHNASIPKSNLSQVTVPLLPERRETAKIRRYSSQQDNLTSGLANANKTAGALHKQRTDPLSRQLGLKPIKSDRQLEWLHNQPSGLRRLPARHKNFTWADKINTIGSAKHLSPLKEPGPKRDSSLLAAPGIVYLFKPSANKEPAAYPAWFRLEPFKNPPGNKILQSNRPIVPSASKFTTAANTGNQAAVRGKDVSAAAYKLIPGFSGRDIPPTANIPVGNISTVYSERWLNHFNAPAQMRKSQKASGNFAPGSGLPANSGRRYIHNNALIIAGQSMSGEQNKPARNLTGFKGIKTGYDKYFPTYAMAAMSPSLNYRRDTALSTSHPYNDTNRPAAVNTELKVQVGTDQAVLGSHEIKKIADRVYREIQSHMKLERQRRGL